MGGGEGAPPDLPVRPWCMYIVTAMQVTIYLPRELGERVKAAGIPVSEVCQRALREELATHGRTAVPDPIPGQLAIPTSRRQ